MLVKSERFALPCPGHSESLHISNLTIILFYTNIAPNCQMFKLVSFCNDCMFSKETTACRLSLVCFKVPVRGFMTFFVSSEKAAFGSNIALFKRILTV